MLHLRVNATDDEIRSAIEQWVQALAEGKRADAYALLWHPADEQLTPERLHSLISNYGSDQPRPDGRTFEVTSPIMAAGGGSRFEVYRYSEQQGKPPQAIGSAEYNLPLNGEWSDLTAIFELLMVDGALGLWLYDVHVL